MSSKFRLTPSTPLPESLEGLSDQGLHVLHSRLRRQMDAEYASGWFSLETEMRLEEVREEFEHRENGAGSVIKWNPQADIRRAS